MHSYIGTHAALRRFERGIEVETHRTLLNILNDPDRFADHLETWVSVPTRPIIGQVYSLNDSFKRLECNHFEDHTWV